MTKPDITPEAVERLAKLLDEDAAAQNSQPCEMTGLLPDDERDAAATLRAQAERIKELEAALDNTDGMGLWRFWSQKSLQLAERTKELEAERDAVVVDRDMMGRKWQTARNDALREAAEIIGRYDEESTCPLCFDVTAINEEVTALIEGDT